MQIEIDEKELSLIYKGLGELPLKETFSLFVKLKAQENTSRTEEGDKEE